MKNPNIWRFVLSILLLVMAYPIEHSIAEAENNRTKAQQAAKPPTPNKEVLLNQLREEIKRLDNELQAYKSERYLVEFEYTKRYYEYLAKKTDLNLAQFEWQRTASEKILWLVVVVVFSGVAFSGYQLWRASKISDLPGDSSIEIAVQKVKITSSVVGVIVLAISIIFFYFFLTEVYRVKVVDLSSTEVKPQDSTKALSEQTENTLSNGSAKIK